MKLRILCKSKIHHAVVTGADIHYIGSIGIDKELTRLTDIAPGEQVAVWNVSNGRRVETCEIELPAHSGEVVVNGAAAHHFSPGDQIIIAAFTLTDEPITPRMVAVDDRNRFARFLGDGEPADLLAPQ
jgi:aspartate 1-decarboxylase